MYHFKQKNTMKDYLLDTLRTTLTAIIMLIGLADIEAFFKAFIALLIAIYWIVRIYKTARTKKEIKEEE